MGGLEPTLYLSFDDGPHPSITPQVLDLLETYDARASFFCIGDNVVKYPDVYHAVQQGGHTVGNHTFHHLNARKSSEQAYLEDIRLAASCISSRLFRPPYGRISSRLVDTLRGPDWGFQTIMWTVLSGDFDASVPASTCAQRVMRTARPGSIIVFHDSEKAYNRMWPALKEVLRHFHEKGFRFEALPQPQ